MKELQRKLDDSLFGEDPWNDAAILYRELLRKELGKLKNA